jgi:S-adenosylmethionine-diacylglycerol 3-amino-3-carboxypropyl transferase
MSRSEIQHRADFSEVRYAQCWEDSRLLTAALEPQGRDCLSIGSAGDNSFALLAAGASAVTAVEMNPAQVACIDLRRASYLTLQYQEFLELMGSRPSQRRLDWYRACRGVLTDDARRFWDDRQDAIKHGIGDAGKFERYFKLFRSRVLPIAHSKRRVMALLEKRDAEGRRRFYEETWNLRRWRWIFQLFFSRRVMGALGRDPEFFKYVEGSVADRILDRTRHGLVELEPADNPYLHWILTGTHGACLPDALREDHFEAIRRALEAGRFEVAEMPLEGWLEQHPERKYGAFNLSDIFEYMNETNTAALLRRIAESSTPGGRLAYWNMLAPRSRPPELSHVLLERSELADELFAADRAFFYSRFVVEEVLR